MPRSYVPVSSTHPVDAVNLKDARLGLYDQLGELIRKHGVEKGRVRLSLGSGEQFASLTVNEYETLLMRYDLAEVLRNPLRFAAQKAKHAWDDPRAVPSKAIDYANIKGFNEITALLLNASTSEAGTSTKSNQETTHAKFDKKQALLDLKELLDSGVLSQNEFDAEKSKILKG